MNWAEKHSINADWILIVALRSLWYWNSQRKSLTGVDDLSLKEELQDVGIAYLAECRQKGLSVSAPPSKLTWWLDNVHGGIDISPFTCHWNPFVETQKAFEKRLECEITEYLDKKKRVFSYKIGIQTYLPTPQHFEWLVLFRIKKMLRPKIKAHDEMEGRAVESLTAITNANKNLSELLKLPLLHNKRAGRPKKSS